MKLFDADNEKISDIEEGKYYFLNKNLIVCCDVISIRAVFSNWLGVGSRHKNIIDAFEANHLGFTKGETIHISTDTKELIQQKIADIRGEA